MPGTFSVPLRVSDPDMHHATCVAHVPWCIPRSLISNFLWSSVMGKTFLAFPAQPAILSIWQDAHWSFIRQSSSIVVMKCRTTRPCLLNRTNRKCQSTIRKYEYVFINLVAMNGIRDLISSSQQIIIWYALQRPGWGAHIRPPYLHNGVSCISKMTSLNWIWAQKTSRANMARRLDFWPSLLECRIKLFYSTMHTRTPTLIYQFIFKKSSDIAILANTR